MARSSSSPSPNRPSLRRRAGGTGLLHIRVGIALVAALVGIGASAILTPRGWLALGGPDNGWTMSSPPGWRVQNVGGEDCQGRRLSGSVLVSNLDRDLHHPDGATTGCWVRWVMQGFPQWGVALEVAPQGTFSITSAPKKIPTCLPLAWADLPPTGGVRGGPTEYFLPITGGGDSLSIWAWVGDEASAEDQRIAEEVLASLRFTAPPSEKGCIEPRYPRDGEAEPVTP